ncbi:hypothetical protein D3218_13435 [Aureimonas flava]|uniref:CobW/HypB/UreG nucleotide-binding domain-containing protein n=1 Tax=Aureimonas flava TaxID=2320271 RepID=A0A3A1WJ59_9HYPH|nr:hypothetical protein [Aureimonas flava]RIY00276.1 hypothetical protein D3218_13435 [Aureimonas flava]
MRKLPVTALSGFLGDGKTVRSNHMLQSREGPLFVTILPDSGGVSVDAGDLLRDRRETARDGDARTVADLRSTPAVAQASQCRPLMGPVLHSVGGDHRQDIVFIGTDPMDEAGCRACPDARPVDAPAVTPNAWTKRREPFPNRSRQAA